MIQYPAQGDEVLTRVLSGGSGDDHLVLLHGVGARADRWCRNIDALAAAGWHVHAPDLPGHGMAQKGHGPDYSVPGFAQFLEGFLDEEGIDTCALVGTSLGGHVAAAFSCTSPHRVRSLVLVGSIGLFPWGSQRRADSRARLRDTSRSGIEAKLRLVVHDQRLVTDEWLNEEFRINNSPGAAESFRAISDYVADHIDDDLIGQPLAQLEDRPAIQLIWGRQERAVPLEVGLAAHALLEGSELAIIDEASHAPYFEQPEEFNRILLSFLARAKSR